MDFVALDAVAIGDRLRRLREARDLSQQALADQLNMSEKTVYALESGIRMPSLDTLHRLATFYHVETDYILYGISKDPQENRPIYAMIDACPQDRLSQLSKVISVFVNVFSDQNT